MSLRIVLRLAVVVGFLMFGHTRADDGPKKVALLVGVNRYKARILVDKPLDYAERDVEELAKVLRGQGFEVKTLTGDGATREAIDAALKETLKGRVADDLVVLGFAGHGVQMPLVDDEGKPVVDGRGKALSDAYFCPVNAIFGRGESMVSLTRLFERLDREGGINILLVDACRDNPDPNRSLGGRVRSLSGDELVGRLPGNSVILFSCSAGQRSLETSKAGGGHGVFFHHVIEGLKGEAADPGTGEVGWDDLVGYVRKNVNRRAKEWEPALGAEADRTARGRLQDPHQLSNLVATPILARRKVDRPSGFAESIGIKVLPLPAGSFWMGSPDSDKKAQVDEKPRHRVTIPAGRGLSAHEITVGQFRRFVDDANYRTEAERDGKGGYGYEETTWKQDPKFTWRNPGFDQSEDHPVVDVSWNDAAEFCRWLTRKDGRTYRLPTEAEWEYACRAGTETRYSNGDDDEGLARVGNVMDASAKRRLPHVRTIEADDGYTFTAPVGRFERNPWGFFDMHGNVWEWCLDYYARDYYKNSPAADPRGPAWAKDRVYRGGSWTLGGGWDCRSANRHGYDPSFRGLNMGFRVARVPSGQ
jgi:formylglycine-generating enzyme required for sulfatase activity